MFDTGSARKSEGELQMSRRSGIDATIASPGKELLLSLSSFERFEDDSSVKFLLTCRSAYFEVRNHNFYSDFSAFRQFLPQLRKIYAEVAGVAELAPSYEEEKIEIGLSTLGQVAVKCSVDVFDSFSQSCRMGFMVDQSYLPSFITHLEDVYAELKIVV